MTKLADPPPALKLPPDPTIQAKEEKRPAGLDTIVHAPASRCENKIVEETVTGVPA